MLASELYAISQGRKCEGKFQCHWCSGPCSNQFIHDEPPPISFQKKSSTLAKCPGDPYICQGCLLFRRKKAGVTSINGDQQDNKTINKMSWLITENEARILNPPFNTLSFYQFLIKPSTPFVLAILKELEEQHLQFLFCNNLSEIRVDSHLNYTIDHKTFFYTVYELEQGIRFGSQGLEPGVRILLDYLGNPPEEFLSPLPPKKEGRGRPSAIDTKITKKIIS